MGEPQFQKVQEGFTAIALDSKVEKIWGMQDEFIGACRLAFNDAG